MSLVLDEHRKFLSDVPRLTGFQRAIAEVVRPGDVVVDLGAGTGVLGLLACRAGAARVYSIESTSMIGVARDIARANNVSDRVRFVKEYSLYVDLPERVDVVVADQIGRFGFEAGVFEYFADARRRFLKPGGVTIPSQIEFVAAPVESHEMWSQIEFWDRSPLGVALAPGQTIARNTGYPVKYDPSNLLTQPKVLAALDPSVDCGAQIRLATSAEIVRTGTLHGVGGWFSAQLSASASITNSPLAADRINRRNVFFPIDRPVAVSPGDRVAIAMLVAPFDAMVGWDVTVTGPDGVMKGESRHSTFAGMLISKEDLARTSPDFAPTLTPRGAARLTVLSLCDGGRRLAELERELYDRHQDLFRTPQEAAFFAAEVITRYAA